MALRKAKQSFNTNKTKKHDNEKTLLAQRKAAKLEIGSIIVWASQYQVVGVSDLITKLQHLDAKILREDV